MILLRDLLLDVQCKTITSSLTNLILINTATSILHSLCKYLWILSQEPVFRRSRSKRVANHVQKKNEERSDEFLENSILLDMVLCYLLAIHPVNCYKVVQILPFVISYYVILLYALFRTLTKRLTTVTIMSMFKDILLQLHMQVMGRISKGNMASSLVYIYQLRVHSMLFIWLLIGNLESPFSPLEPKCQPQHMRWIVLPIFVNLSRIYTLLTLLMTWNF